MTGIGTSARLAVLAAAICATFVLFALWPTLDLTVTALFYDPGEGFRAVDEGLANSMRLVIWRLSEALLAAALLSLVIGLWTGGEVLALPRRLWGFIVLLYLLGPGLLVDVVVKPLWGRARPADVEAFGGTLPFTPPHVIADVCNRNCSFPAGEVAGAVALAVSAWLILRHVFPGRNGATYRAGVFLCILVPLFTAFQRIAGGRHFLSDSMLSALFVLTIAVVLHAALFHRSP